MDFGYIFLEGAGINKKRRLYCMLFSMKKYHHAIKTVFFHVTALLLVLIFVFFVLEGGLRIVSPLWKYIYRQFSDDAIYVYVIGGSVSLGEPYHPDISFPKIISYLFNGEINGKKLKIINVAPAGQPLEYGYWKLFKEFFFAPPKKGILLIYAGINEHIYNKDAIFVNKWNILQHSIVLSKIYWILRCGERHRGSLPEFAYQLEKTIRLALRYDVVPIISTLVYNFSEYLPREYPFNKYGFMKEYMVGKKYENDNMFEEALTVYEQILNSGTEAPPFLYYRLGKCFEHLNHYKKARAYYWLALEEGRFPLLSQNLIIKDVARKYNIRDIDMAHRFEQESLNGLVGYNLFVDNVHPNLNGYSILAGGFAQEIEKVMNARVRFKNPSEEDIFNHFNFDKRDLFDVYISNVRTFTYYICSSVNPPAGRIKRSEYYLKQAEALFPHDPQILLGRLMIAVAKKEKSDVMDILHTDIIMNDHREVLCQDIYWLEPYLRKLIPASTVQMIKKNGRESDYYE